MTRKRLAERIDEDLKDLIPRFLANVIEDAAAIRAAVLAGDMGTAMRLGHSLKGSGFGYGFTGLGDIGRQLEFEAAQGCRASCLNLCDKLADYLERVEPVFVPDP